MQFEHIDVSTYSGFKADERPVSFIWRGREYRIHEIIDRWYEGGLKTWRSQPQLFQSSCR